MANISELDFEKHIAACNRGTITDEAEVEEIESQCLESFK
jgi:hypothetical protein